MNNITNSVRANDNLVDILKAVLLYINVWLGTFLVVMGNLSWIGNLIVFRSAVFRHRACTIYLLAETISDFFLINYVLLTRVLEDGYGFIIENSSAFMCKTREAASFFFNSTSMTFFAFAAIDRILATQRANSLRKWSNHVSLAYKMVIISTLFWIFFYAHRLFLYDMVDGECEAASELFGSIDNYMQAILLEFCPLFTVLLLTYLLKRSLRNVVERQANIIIFPRQQNVIKRSQLQQIDSQLTLMLMLQSIVALITFTPFGCYIVYKRLITDTWERTSLQKAGDKIFSHTSRLLSYTFFASSFHISIISCSGFRHQIKRLFRKNKIHAAVTGSTKAAKTRTVE